MMAADGVGRTRPIACGTLVVKSVKGRPCSRLPKALCDSGGSKSVMERSVLPRKATLTQSNSRMLMNTLAGTCAPLSPIEVEGLEKTRITGNHNFVVFDQP